MPRPYHPRSSLPALPLLALFGLVASCASPLPRTLDEAYDSTLQVRTGGGFHDPDEATEKRLKAGRDVVRADLEAGEVRTANEHVRAAFVLVSSRDLDDLDLAHKVAWQAGELGDPRGWPLAAEALDRALFIQGQPQRFGTQYVYEPVLERWILYDVDPATSDAERQRFGIPPLSALRDYAARLNEAKKKN